MDVPTIININRAYYCHSNQKVMIFKKTIPSDRDASIALVFEALVFLRHLKSEGYAMDVSEFNMRLVLDEAIENAMRHGNGYDPCKTVSVWMRGYKKKITIRIEDQGRGFNHQQPPAYSPHENKYARNGRGLVLMSHLGTVTWNSDGNCVMIEVY